jgi:hypothetical protein
MAASFADVPLVVTVNPTSITSASRRVRPHHTPQGYIWPTLSNDGYDAVSCHLLGAASEQASIETGSASPPPVLEHVRRPAPPSCLLFDELEHQCSTFVAAAVH